MASETQKKSKSNVDYKYAVHFDLERNEIKQVKSNTILDNGRLSGSGNRIYKDIQAFLKNNGFDDKQKSGYETCKPMSKREVFDTIDELFEKYPILDSTVPGSNQKYTKSVYITKIAGSHQYIKDHDLQSVDFDQRDIKCKKQIAFDLDTNAMARDGKLKSNVYSDVCNYFTKKGLINRKQRSVYVLNKSITTQDAVNMLDDIRSRVPDFDKYCKECTITDVISNTDYMTYREKQKKKDPNFWPQYATYPIISNGTKNHAFDGIPLDKKMDVCVRYNTDARYNDSSKKDAAIVVSEFSTKLKDKGFRRIAKVYYSDEPTTIGDVIDMVHSSYDDKQPNGDDSLFKQRMQNVWVTVKESDVLSSHASYTNKSLSANAVKDAEELLSNINFDSDNYYESKDIK
jgi:virulence-associated protein VapD